MSPGAQAVLLPIVFLVFAWRLVVLLRRRAYASQSDPLRDAVVVAHIAVMVFAAATYYGIQSTDDGQFVFRVWLVWLEYLAIMVLVYSLGKALGARSAGHPILIGVVACVTAGFAMRTPGKWSGLFVDAPTSLLWLYVLSAGVYIPIGLLAIALRLYRQPKPKGSVRITAAVLVAGTIGLTIGFVLNAVEFGFFLSRNPLPAAMEPVSRALLDSGLVLIVVGILAPALASRAAYLRRTQHIASELRRMRPLADDIARRLPQLSPDSGERAVPLTPSQIRLAHYRRYVHIRDALTWLSPHLGDSPPAAVAARLHELLAQPIPQQSSVPRPLLIGGQNDVHEIVALCEAYNRAAPTILSPADIAMPRPSPQRSSAVGPSDG